MHDHCEILVNKRMLGIRIGRIHLLLVVFVVVEYIELIAKKHLVLHLMLIYIDAYQSQDYDVKPFLLLIPKDRYDFFFLFSKGYPLTSAVVTSVSEYSAREPSSRKIRILFVPLLNIGSILCTGFFPLRHSLMVLYLNIQWIYKKFFKDLRVY
jgi:hypothetical protein